MERSRGAVKADSRRKSTASRSAGLLVAGLRAPHPPQDGTSWRKQDRRARLITDSREQSVSGPVAAVLRTRRQPREVQGLVVGGQQRPCGVLVPRTDRDVSELVVRAVWTQPIDVCV
ncbi:hypothetical protein ACLQ28_31400 [Micromonospora sp. DT201]|uniref:hypothetical protein n=1 Tax=Micromonospora sp. DT201 TaxID=3393442 RepID=UPI003CF67470